MANFLHNRLDNADFYSEVIISDPVLTRLITRFIDHPPFAGERWSCVMIPAMAHIITYVRYRRAGIEDPDIIKVRAGAIAECLGPALSDDRYLAHADAVERVRSIGTWIRHNLQHMTDLTSASESNYEETRALIRLPANRFGLSEALVPAQLPVAPVSEELLQIHEAIVLIIHAAHHASEWVADYNLSALLHLHMAVAKQGNVTTRFINKVRQGVHSDLQVQIDVSPALVKAFWNTFRTGLNENNVAGIFTNWGNWIPEMALRMRLVVQQTALTGLTILSTIGKALKLHPNFPWGRIAMLLPADTEAYRTAVSIVGNNQYYGYKRDLGPVSSTRYKSLGYVACQLLVKANAMTTLNGYKGWPRTIPHQAIINQMIDDYVAQMEDQQAVAGVSETARALIARIMEVVTDNDNAAVYA